MVLKFHIFYYWRVWAPRKLTLGLHRNNLLFECGVVRVYNCEQHNRLVTEFLARLVSRFTHWLFRKK